MQILLHTEMSLTLRSFAEPAFEILSGSPEQSLGAIEMFIVSLGLCTGSVLMTYGQTTSTAIDDLSIDLSWSYEQDPYRIGHIDVQIRWPSLSEARLRAAERAAAQCTLHPTLAQPPSVETRVSR